MRNFSLIVYYYNYSALAQRFMLIVLTINKGIFFYLDYLIITQLFLYIW